MKCKTVGCLQKLPRNYQYKHCPSCRKGRGVLNFLQTTKEKVKKFNMKTTGNVEIDKKLENL